MLPKENESQKVVTLPGLELYFANGEFPLSPGWLQSLVGANRQNLNFR